MWGQLLVVCVVLLLIGAAAWATVHYLKPKLESKLPSGRMEIVEKLTLEPRRSLYTVRIDKEEWVVGVSEGGIRLICKLSKENANAGS